jgi:mRNA-degrading endonuclease RelE of RelBE toxin-antitoxin system
MLSVVQLSAFTRRLKRRLSDEAYRKLEDRLARDPEAGALIPGAGGIRKIRWADEHRGKRGGVRVVYYHRAASGRIYMLDLYAKNEKDDLTQAEWNALARMLDGFP